jgi:hypothetical protein
MVKYLDHALDRTYVSPADQTQRTPAVGRVVRRAAAVAALQFEEAGA